MVAAPLDIYKCTCITGGVEPWKLVSSYKEICIITYLLPPSVAYNTDYFNM